MKDLDYIYLQVLELIEQLRTSMKEIITDVDWMEDSTKTFAKDKVRFCIIFIELYRCYKF